MALTSGARKGEILAMTWDCIDFNNRVAVIKDSKNGKPRKIGLVSSVLTELKQLFIKKNPSKVLIFASKTAFGK